MKKVYSIYCDTGCTCCGYENYSHGFYRTKEEAEQQMNEWRAGNGSPVRSQYQRNGRYSLDEHDCEQLPDGRYIIDRTVYNESVFDHKGNIEYLE